LGRGFSRSGEKRVSNWHNLVHLVAFAQKLTKLRKMKTIVLFLTCMLCVTGIMAQRAITGKVTDETGNPVTNASVTVKETGAGVSTDASGNFSIQADDRTRTLIFSYVDKTSAEIAINGRSVINVSLRPLDRSLQEVVVVAYGVARKSALTNSVAQISAKELENRPVTNVLSALTGIAPGVTGNSTNGQPGSSPAIRIRGFGSINGSNAPLYVVDGVPYDYDISNINVDDIETLSVLKDAAAASLYGSRAANGVIQITTKRGKKDRSQVQVSAAQGFISRAVPEYKRVDAFQYYPLMWEAYRNSLAFSATPIPIDSANKIASGLFPRNSAGLQVYNGKTYSDISQLLAYNPFNVPRTDIVRVNGELNPSAQLLYGDDLNWLGAIQRNGTRSDYTVAVSGGTAKTDNYFSLGYVNEKGFLLNSDYKRYSGRLNLNTQALSWLKTGISLAANVTVASQGPNDASGAGGTALVNPFASSRVIGPIYPVYAHNTTTGDFILDASGNKIYDIGSLANLGLPNRPVLTGRHAVYETLLNENILKRNVFSGRTYGEISFLKYFKFTTNISADISNSLRSQYENKIVGDGAPNGRSRRNTTDNLTMTINQLLNYNQSFGDHSVEVLVGHENYDATFRAMTNLRTGQVIEGITELSNFTTTSSLTSAKDKYRIESLLSRISYAFKNRYFFSGSFRRDGSSRFSSENRWGNFWSVGGGWKVDQEDFMQNVSFINALKLRSSYGLVGNDALLDANNLPIYYAYQSFYDLGANNNTEPGAVQSTDAGNPDLTWEVNKQFDIALEFSLFKSRINGTVEYFDRRSSSLLFRVPPPVSTGTESFPENIGTMYNKGIEVNLNGDIIRNRDFSWNMGINWTTFKNKITKLPAEEIPSTASSTQKWQVGHSRYEFWLREYYGVDPTDGSALYRSNIWIPATSRIVGKNDTVTIDQNNARLHYAGTAIPDFFGSVLSSFNYRGFGLSFQLNYSVGGKVYDDNWAQLIHSGSYGVAWSPDILKRWQKPGDITNIPRVDADATKVAAFGALSDRYLIDASYLSIQNVTFSYVVPVKLLSQVHMQSAKFYISAENLHMFTKRQGMDPLQNFTGVTSNVFTPSRTVTAGINLTL
jgi:TonB-linked SusC/RagA family outer membrane protein